MNIQILIENRNYVNAKSFLNLWSDCFLKLERENSIRRNVVSNRDNQFLKNIGDSVYYLNSFNSTIINNLEENIKKDKGHNVENLERLVSYIKYHNSLIASKVKFFFFREQPVKNSNDPFMDIDLQIFKAGNDILQIFKTGRDFNNIEPIVYNFFYLQCLLYSFIYDFTKDKGVFLKFSYKKELFCDIQKFVKHNVSKMNSEDDIREFGSNFIANIVLYYNNKHRVENKRLKKPECYTTFYETLTTSPNISIEPFTCYLGDLIWKIDGMIHDDDEFRNESDKAVRDKKLLNLIQNFINRYLNEINSSYNSATINFHKLYSIESIFLEKIYSLLLFPKNINEVRRKFDRVEECFKNTVIKCSVKTEKTVDTKKIYKTLGRIIETGEKGFKLEHIIEKLDIREILSLVNLYSTLIPKHLINNDKCEYIGFYKSGVILGHLINILNGTNKPIWLFKSKPYVATHPIHIDENNNSFNNIIIFDESIKTGFTYSLYESYLTRNLPNSNLTKYIISLFNFQSYIKIELNKELNSRSLFKLNENNIPTNTDEINFLQQFNKEIENIDINTGNIKDVLEHEIIEKIIHVENNAKRINLTYLISNTKALFTICNIFADKICSSNTTNKDIYLFTASTDGEVLILVTALLLKNKKCKNLYLTSPPASFTNTFSVGIDMSYMSGFSLKYTWSIMRHGSYKKNNNDYEKELDLILTILSTKANNSKFHTLFNTSETI